MKFAKFMLCSLLLVGCSHKNNNEEVVIDENYLITLDWNSFESQEELDSFMDSLSPELYELAITLQGRVKPDAPDENIEDQNYNGEQVAFTFNPNMTYTVGIDIEPGKYNFMSEDSYVAYAYDANGEMIIGYNGCSTCEYFDGDVYTSGEFIDLEEGQQLKFSANAKIGNMKREALTFDKTFTDADGYFMDSANKTYLVGEDIAEGKYRMSSHPYYSRSSTIYFLDENSNVISEEWADRQDRIIYLTVGDRIKVTSGLALLKYN